MMFTVDWSKNFKVLLKKCQSWVYCATAWASHFSHTVFVDPHDNLYTSFENCHYSYGVRGFEIYMTQWGQIVSNLYFFYIFKRFFMQGSDFVRRAKSLKNPPYCFGSANGQLISEANSKVFTWTKNWTRIIL